MKKSILAFAISISIFSCQKTSSETDSSSEEAPSFIMSEGGAKCCYQSNDIGCPNNVASWATDKMCCDHTKTTPPPCPNPPCDPCN